MSTLIDKGCRYAPLCLECPFPDCVEGMSGKELLRFKRELKQKKIGEMISQGKSYREIASELGVSVWTVRRIDKGKQDADRLKYRGF